MRVAQRIFTKGKVVLVVALFAWGVELGVEAGERLIIADGKIAIELPRGWEETELNADNPDVLAGYATEDQHSSIFFQALDPGSTGTMQGLLHGTIANFDETFEMTRVDDEVTGEVRGVDQKWPAIFCTAEGIVEKGTDEFAMRFYLLVFDTGTGLYFVQASTTLPVRQASESEIYELIRSIVAKS
ncbi:MAG: hypothetical protein AAGA96_14760 [Verrucomicrobiota bacterium]